MLGSLAGSMPGGMNGMGNRTGGPPGRGALGDGARWCSPGEPGGGTPRPGGISGGKGSIIGGRGPRGKPRGGGEGGITLSLSCLALIKGDSAFGEAAMAAVALDKASRLDKAVSAEKAFWALVKSAVLSSRLLTKTIMLMKMLQPEKLQKHSQTNRDKTLFGKISISQILV